MIVAGLANSWKLELLQAMAADVFRIALYTKDAVLSKQTTVYTTAGEVFGPGYQAGGQVLGGFTAIAFDDLAVAGWTIDPVWPDATIRARGALIYNYSRENRALAVLDFGEDIAGTHAPFRVTLPPVTVEAALIRIGG